MTSAPDRGRGPGAPAPLSVPPELTGTIVLVRHGQSTWLAEGRFQGRGDTPLSPLGERQAALAGKRLADPAAPPRLPVPAGDPIAIVHSPLARTTQTAEAVARAFAARGRPAPPLVPDPGLMEIAQGEWEGLFQVDVEARYPVEIEGWRRDPVNVHAPGGEALREVDTRVRAALQRVVDRLAGAAGLGGVGAPAAAPRSATDGPGSRLPSPSYYDPHHGPWVVLAGHDGAFKVAVLALLGLPLERFWSFTQTTTGIAVFDVRTARTILRAWNRTEHLAELEVEAGEAERKAQEDAADRARTGAL